MPSGAYKRTQYHIDKVKEGRNKYLNSSNMLKQRFWSKVKKTKSCWLWIGATRNKNSYGNIRIKCKRILAHRFSWKLHFGKIPKDICVLHKCDNPICVNPNHLFLGTLAENNRDRMKKKTTYGSRGTTSLTIQISHLSLI